MAIGNDKNKNEAIQNQKGKPDSKKINENIEFLCSYFKRQIDVIGSLIVSDNILKQAKPTDLQVLLYKKSLLVAMLDSMAGFAFSEKHFPDLHNKNRERFIRFIKEYANWNNGNLINVPFLYDRLSKSKDREVCNGNLTKHLIERLSQFDTSAGKAIPVDRIDEEPKVLSLLVRTELEKKEIEKCQHYSILYRYRNYLVHEAREPGLGMEISKATDAYYHGYLGKEGEWFLVYPLDLFKKLCSETIDNLKHYLIDSQIDPYEYDILEDTSRF